MVTDKIYCDNSSRCRSEKFRLDHSKKNNLKSEIQSFFEKLNYDLKRNNNCFIAGTYIFEGDDVFNLCCPCAVQRSKFQDKFVSHEFFMYDEKFQRQKLTNNKSFIEEGESDKFNIQYEIHLPKGIKYPCDSEPCDSYKETEHCKKNLEHKRSILFYKFKVKDKVSEYSKTYTFVKLERYITYKLFKLDVALHVFVMVLHYMTNYIKNNSYPHRREDMIYHSSEVGKKIKLQPKHVVHCEDKETVKNHNDDILTVNKDEMINALNEQLTKSSKEDKGGLMSKEDIQDILTKIHNNPLYEESSNAEKSSKASEFPKDYNYKEKCFTINKPNTDKITVDPTTIYTEYDKDCEMLKMYDLEAFHHYNKHVRLRNELFLPTKYYQKFLPQKSKPPTHQKVGGNPNGYGGKTNVSYKKYGKYTVLANGKQRNRIVWIYNRQFFIKRRDGSYEKIKKKNII